MESTTSVYGQKMPTHRGYNLNIHCGASPYSFDQQNVTVEDSFSACIQSCVSNGHCIAFIYDLANGECKLGTSSLFIEEYPGGDFGLLDFYD
jgi:hypothetical protein